MYPTAYTVDNLDDILESNTNVPQISADERDRLLSLARRRAASRGEQNALEDNQTDCIITTDWTTFAQNEFGYDAGGDLNEFALGIFERATGNATLFTDTYVVQGGWLSTGDGRKSQLDQYVDDEYAQSDDGEMWVPKGAQDYVAIIRLSDELLHDAPTAAEAMA